MATTERDPALADRTAAGAAFESVRRLELLLDHWGGDPPGVLRSGGLAVRDLKAAADLLGVDGPTAALLIETAAGPGCSPAGPTPPAPRCGCPPTSSTPGTVWTPAERWVRLVRAWLTSPRLPSLVGSRDPAGKTWNALAPELASHLVAESREMTLAALADLAPGASLAAGTGLPSLLEVVAWRRPRRPRSRADQVAWTVTEAGVLGLTGLDALASYARALIADDDPVPGLAALLPEPVDHVLVQADLTAVAPGPLEASLARQLALVAEVESRGGATVYRFTPGSVRRALDVGWTAVELHAFLASVSRTPVPQPLTYLVDDTVRTFGTLRAGPVEAYLRADDEVLLSELLAHPRAASLGLRRLAPTVVVSTTPLDVLLPRLRDLGAAAVVESPDGTLQVRRPDQLRARVPRDRRAALAAVPARDAARAASAVTAIRAGDRAARTRPAATALSPSGALTALRSALEEGTTVVIGFLDNHGVASDRVVDPRSVEGGQLVAFDHRTDDVRTFAVHRITSVRGVEAS